MRTATWSKAILACVLLPPVIQAEPAVPYTFENRAVTPAEVEVWSGPSENRQSFSPTCRLTRGEIVQVVTNKKDVPPGWLAIRPPRSSFSWVNARLVRSEPNHNTGVVLAMDTPVLAGSALDNRPPSVRSAVLDRGAMVVILGQPLLTSDGSRWFPIEPHPTEVRILPPQRWPRPPSAPRPLLPRNPTSPIAMPATAPPTATNPATGPSVGAGTLTSPRPASYAPGATSLYGPAPATSAPAPAGWTSSAPAARPAEQWEGPGWLRKTSFEFENKPVYRLETYEKVICYVVAQPGFSLDAYLAQKLNHPVYLYGSLSYRAEMSRAPIMAARSGQAAQ